MPAKDRFIHSFIHLFLIAYLPIYFKWFFQLGQFPQALKTAVMLTMDHIKPAVLGGKVVFQQMSLFVIRNNNNNFWPNNVFNAF